MPRVNLGKLPADDVMGLFLERKRALKLTNADMAKYLGCSSATFSRLLDTNTVNWKLCDIFKLAKALGIEKEKIRAAI